MVVLSYVLWRDRFASDPAAGGRMLKIDGQSHVIVGVAPLHFAFPNREARLWVPMWVEPPAVVVMSDAIPRLAPSTTASRGGA